jgi:carboxylesterase type B
MFWVYGGAYYSGSNLLYGMERIGDVADVIMVAVNYRIGTLGT